MKLKQERRACFMLLVKMVEAPGKKQLEELAKRDSGVRLNLEELKKPFDSCDKCEIIQLPSRKIYYYCNKNFCDDCPRQCIPQIGYRKILAIYEDNKLQILKTTRK